MINCSKSKKARMGSCLLKLMSRTMKTKSKKKSTNKTNLKISMNIKATLLCLIVGGDQISNFGKKTSQVHLIIIRE